MKTAKPWWRRIWDTLTGKPATTPAKKTTPKTHPGEFYVYVTKTGKKYHHDPCCPAILDAFNRGDAIKMAVSKAEAAGRTPCGKCCGSDYE